MNIKDDYKLPLLAKIAKLHWREKQFHLFSLDYNNIALLIAVVATFLYLWGAMYHVFFSHSITAFRQPPWFILQVLLEQNGVGGRVFLATGMLAFAASFVFLRNVLRRRELDRAYGNAHFAKEHEVRRAGLRAKKGVVLGVKGFRFLFFNGEGHILVYWPTGSGKGVGIVIPNLLNWPDSTITQDIKQENFKKTSGFRAKHGQKVVLLNFMNPTSLRYNPCFYVRRDKVNRIGDIQRITFILYSRANDKGEIWNPEARSLFLALALYVLDTDPDSLSIGEVLRISKANADFRHFILVALSDHAGMLDPITVQNFNKYLQKSHREASSIMTTLTSMLELWDNPIVDAVTSGNDFDLRELRKIATSIYVGVAPGDLSIVSPLLNLFYEQTIDLMTRYEPGDDEPLEILFPFDEFTAAGKLKILEKSIPFVRSYRMKFMPIIQGPSQLVSEYGEQGYRNFVANFRIRSIAAQNDDMSAKAVSDMLGTKTVKVETLSHKALQLDHSPSVTHSRMGQPLMKPSEIRELNRRNVIIIQENEPPVMAKKIRYYLNLRMFLRTLIPPVVVPTIDVEAHRRSTAQSIRRYIVNPEHPAVHAVSLDDLASIN